MEDEDTTRPAIGFPLGLALLFFILFCMGSLFACCIYWDRLQSFLGASSDQTSTSDIEEADIVHSPHKTPSPQMEPKQDEGQSRPVLMPGDSVPKFIATACSSEHPRLQEITVKVQKQPPFPVPDLY